MKKITITSVAATVLALPAVSLAVTAAGEVTGKGEAVVTQLTTILNRLGTWALILLGALATFYIILAAIKFVTAKGDKTAIEEARKEITYALVALVVGAIAKLVTSIVGGIASGIN